MVQQVTRTGTCCCTDTIGVAQTKLIELVLAVKVLAVVGLISHQDYRKLGTTQDECYVLIEVGKSVLDVNQEQDQIGLLCGNDDLLADFLFEHIVRVYHPAARVDNGEFAAVPFALTVLAVAGSTSLVAHNGAAAVCQSVK